MLRSGPARNIDVYGVYPPITECTGGSTQGGSEGYFLGGVTRDLIEDSIITIPVSYTAGSPGTVTCDGGNHSQTTFKYFVYAVNNNNQKIYGFEANIQGGGLTPLSTPDYTVSTGGPQLTSITIHPNKKFLYVAASTGQIFGYSIAAATGVLTPLNGGAEFFTMSGPSIKSIKVRPSGDYIYFANSSNNMHWFPVDASTGTVTNTAGSITTVNNPFYFVFHPSLNILYAAINAGPVGIKYFDINSGNGNLTNHASSPIDAAINFIDVIVHPYPTGTAAYASTTAPSLRQYTLNGAGVLSLNGTPVATTTNAANRLRGFSTSSYVLASNGTAGCLSTYLVNGTGTLTEVSVMPTPAGYGTANCDGIAVMPDGPYVYVTDSSTDLTSGIFGYYVNEANGVALTNFLSGSLAYDTDGYTVDIDMVKIQQP